MNNILNEITQSINANGESREYLLSLIKDDLGIQNLDNECSHIVDDVDELDYQVSFEEIVEAVINRVTNIIESYEEDIVEQYNNDIDLDKQIND